MSNFESIMDELKQINSEMKEEDRLKTAKPDYVGGHIDGSRFKKTFYKTMEEAGKAAVALGVKSSSDYKKLYKKDKLLPSNPSIAYGNVWCKNGKWLGFLSILH